LRRIRARTAASSDAHRPPRTLDTGVASRHFLLALFDDQASLASKVLASFGLERASVERRIDELGTDGTSDELPADQAK
jgi:hypothetical protein